MAARTAILRATARLNEIIERERDTLKASPSARLDHFNDAKSRCLLEITRAVRNIDTSTPDPHLQSELRLLREKLNENRNLLAKHLEAARKVSGIVMQALRDDESDGTYGG